MELNDNLASKLERLHVHEVYQKIADHFHHTRMKPWPKVKSFVESLSEGSVLIDVGCGNGKYLGFNPHITKIGCDKSEKLAQICLERGYECLVSDCLHLPFISEVADACICIAVLHHLASEKRRLRAIGEIVRILRVGGRALIYVWAKDQKFDGNDSVYCRYNCKNAPIEETVMKIDDIPPLPVGKVVSDDDHYDMLVPWVLKRKKNENNRQENGETFLRFYHLFEVGELKALCESFPQVRVLEYYYETGNWCILIEKVE